MHAQLTATPKALLARFADHPHLPTPPAIALQVLDKVSRPDCTASEVGRLISHDPALCGTLLRTINSALYGLPRPVTSVNRAVALLGLKAIRSLILSLSLPALNRRTGAEGWTCSYWRSSVAGAIVARELALRLRRPDPEDDLVAGLLRDVGMLLLRQVYPEEYASVLAYPTEELVSRQCELERSVLNLDHAEAGAYVLERWRLPKEITEAIRCHHDLGQAAALAPAVAERARLLCFATQVAQLQLAPQDTELCQPIRELARDQFGMDDRQLSEFLAALGPKVQEFAEILHVHIGPGENYAAILTRATDELVRLTIETNLAHQRTCAEKNQAEEAARRWRRAAQRLRHKADTDPLSGLYNQGAFVAALEAEVRVAQRGCTLLGLVFLDLDGFKLLNDRFGHAFGDQVLKDVTGLLHQKAGERNLVARLGGDEFCVLVPNACESEVGVLAHRIQQAIDTLTIRRGDDSGRVGASVGAVTCFPRPGSLTAEQILKAADDAMYVAKRAGKNQVHLLALLSPEDRRLIEEIRRRRFSTYLITGGHVSEPQVGAAIRLTPSPRWPLGRLARKLGWINAEALRQALVEQRRTRRPFGEVAVAQGCLTPAQLSGLLAMQQEWPDDLAESLVELGALTENAAREALDEYYRLARAEGKT